MNNQSEDTLNLTIGSIDSDHLQLRILKIHEADWIEVELNMVSCRFNGTFVNDDFLARYFTTLRHDFERLYHELSGEAKFETLGQIVQWQISGDGLGHFDFLCCLHYETELGCRIEFSFSFDQTYITRSLRELDEIIAQITRETTNENKEQPKCDIFSPAVFCC